MRYTLILLLCFCSFGMVTACSEDPDYLDYSDKINNEGQINYSTNFEWNFELFADNGHSNQSAACFGDYTFQVTDRLSSITMYNLKEKKIYFSKSLSTHNEKTSSGNPVFHCNQSTFSNIFYEENDNFPLLYISQRGDTLGRCFIEVYRPITTINENGIYNFFNPVKVQRIFLPKANKDNALGNANMVIDQETGNIYTYSRNNKSSDSNYLTCRITQWYIPISDEQIVYLNDSNIVDSYEIDCSAYTMQGGCIHHGYLYIGQGYANQGKIRIVDLTKKKLVTTLDIKKGGYKLEPEGCFWYDGRVMISSGKYIHEFKINTPDLALPLVSNDLGTKYNRKSFTPMGTEVNGNYRGIVIRNAKKIIKK